MLLETPCLGYLVWKDFKRANIPVSTLHKDGGRLPGNSQPEVWYEIPADIFQQACRCPFLVAVLQLFILRRVLSVGAAARGLLCERAEARQMRVLQLPAISSLASIRNVVRTIAFKVFLLVLVLRASCLKSYEKELNRYFLIGMFSWRNAKTLSMSQHLVKNTMLTRIRWRCADGASTRFICQ